MTKPRTSGLVLAPTATSLVVDGNWVLREDCLRAIAAAVAGDWAQVAALLGIPGLAGEWAQTLRRPLTRRECEVAELIALGLTNKQIARRLVMAKRTADTHVHRILRKLECASRAQVAVLIATNQRPNGPAATPF
jgi:DNA-binding NarL/FixJ family response regulator